MRGLFIAAILASSLGTSWVALGQTPTPTIRPCCGDCTTPMVVTGPDCVHCYNVSVGSAPYDACCDCRGVGSVSASDYNTCLENVFTCSDNTPTVTPTLSPTRTETPTRTPTRTRTPTPTTNFHTCCDCGGGGNCVQPLGVDLCPTPCAVVSNAACVEVP